MFKTLHRYRNLLHSQPKRQFALGGMFFTQKEAENHYQILKVKTASTQKDIKLAYYKMAKKHHPDFQQHASDKDKFIAEEFFKDVVKAYEILSNPIMRQAYDIEHRINEGVNLDTSTFTDSRSQKSYLQPRTQTDFYHTKWTGYKKPKWYHPYNGIDGRSEYLYRKTTNSYLSPKWEIGLEFAEQWRFFIYLGIFVLWNCNEGYRWYLEANYEALQMEILEKSFQAQSLGGLIASLGLDDDDDSIEMDSRMQLALDDYIKERQSMYETGFKVEEDVEEDGQPPKLYSVR